MKYEMLKYECDSCHCCFKAPEEPEQGEGRLGFRSHSREWQAYLNTCDPFKEELDAMLENAQGFNHMDINDQVVIALKIIGLCCDCAPDGTEYEHWLCPKCPSCGCARTCNLEATQPSEFVELDIPHVPHRAWDTADEEGKKRMFNEALKKLRQRYPKLAECLGPVK